MTKSAMPGLSPIGFFQTFVVQSLRAAGQMGCSQCDANVGKRTDQR